MFCQLPRWHLCPDRQLLSLAQIYLPRGNLLEIRSPAQFKSVSRWSCPRSGVELPSLSTPEAALSQNLMTTVPFPQPGSALALCDLPRRLPKPGLHGSFSSCQRAARARLLHASHALPALSWLPNLSAGSPPHSRAPRGTSPAYLPGWTAPSRCLGWSRASGTGIM